MYVNHMQCPVPREARRRCLSDSLALRLWMVMAVSCHVDARNQTLDLGQNRENHLFSTSPPDFSRPLLGGRHQLESHDSLREFQYVHCQKPLLTLLFLKQSNF